MESDEFEKISESGMEAKGERAVPPGQDFEESFKDGVPEFAGDKYGVANPENQYYGEAKDDASEMNGDDIGLVENGLDEGDDAARANEEGAARANEKVDMGGKYNAGIADAAALINYGLDAAARNLGVGVVVKKIKEFNADGRADPIGDLFKELGVDTPEEWREIRREGEVAATTEAAFREGANAPSQNKSYTGALVALKSMKELIGEVEGADVRYEKLRNDARAAGKGVFDYAVSEFDKPGLTELFDMLAVQGESNGNEGAVDDAGVTGESMGTERMLEDETGAELADGVLGVTEQDKEIERELGSSMGERETLNPEILKPQE